MTQVQEHMTIMDGGPQSSSFSTKSKRTFIVSQNLAVIIACVVVLALVATAFIVYNFAACPKVEHLSHIPVQGFFNNSSSTEPIIPCYEASGKYQTSTNKITLDDTKPGVLLLNNTKPDVRLPRSIRPVTYKLKLIPFIFEKNFTFNGEVSIVINVTADTKNITLHATDLNIYERKVYLLTNNTTSEEQFMVSYTYDRFRQFYVLHMENELLAGQFYQIDMKYTGLLNDDLRGFYRSSYTVGNDTRWIATTQFQPTDARRAFPCFDEPALKARFTISIARTKNMSSISNMNIVATSGPIDDMPDYVWDHYAESLPMSTYLVAFVVCDFDKRTDGIFTVWARHDAIKSAAYSLEVGPKILKFYENFYQIPFPLPKIDMIALPDFNAGAMENWGLITFREAAMLYDKDISARSTMARVAAVVAHELAHQWFGNLVTPEWWSDLWLNEGFASYLEYLGVDAIEKSWKTIEQFVVNDMHLVFNLDALASSHQISVEVGNPDEINEIFDRISYGKGATILRMMNHFLTEDVFTKGITAYLESRKFQSAEQNDLWSALTAQARVSRIFDNETSVKTIMDTWTLQTGFPIVTAKRNYRNQSIHLTQERFVLIKNPNDTVKPRWWIPITFTTEKVKDFDTTKPNVWMKGDESIKIPNVKANLNEWIVFNIQQTGFYRVNYDIQNWNLIIKYLNDPQRYQGIPPINRAQLLDDAMNLALAGRINYHTALDITKYLAHESSHIPWKAGLIAFGYIDAMLAKTQGYLEYKKYILNLLESVIDEVGFDQKPEDGLLKVYKRVDILTAACHLEHPGCVRKAVMLFYQWTMTPNPDVYNDIPPDIRGLVYCAAVSSGSTREWEFIWERFKAVTVGSEREVLLTALGCSRSPWLLMRFMDLAIQNNTGIRKQDVYRVFGSTSNTVIGQSVAFSFVRTNWQRIKNYLGSSSTNLNTIIKYSTRRMNQRHELEELRKFADEHKGELGRTIEQAIEKSQANIQWMDQNYDTIIKWLLAATSSREDIFNRS